MRIKGNESLGLVIDLQEKLFPHMDQKEALLQRTVVLLEGLHLLDIPLIYTEQYPRGLGPSLKQIGKYMSPGDPVEKITFSCCDDDGFSGTLKSSGRKTVIICGIETHVCVLQTAMDMLEEGYIPVVVEDCTSSRHPEDKRVALERMRASGVLVTTCESVLFELTRKAGSEVFKQISGLIKPL